MLNGEFNLLNKITTINLILIYTMIKLTNLLTESPKPKNIHVSYIERSGKLYKIKVDSTRVYEDDFKKQFGVDIPTRYDERELSKIEKIFKKNRIQFTYDDSIDVS